jgi:arginine decarboxylase
MPEERSRPNLNIHFNAPSVRYDKWAELRAAASRLSGRSADAKLRSEIEELLKALGPMESFWGFPGRKRFEALAEQFKEQQFERFREAVTETSNSLDSGSYRDEAVTLALGEASPGVKYFEVLVVGAMTASEEDRFKVDLAKWRCKRDDFVYNIVVVNSFEDALISVLFNFNILACVIQDDFHMTTESELQGLDALQKGLQRYDHEAAETNPVATLGDYIHQLRPEINQFLSTQVSPEKLASQTERHFDRIFYRHESSGELHFSILKGVSERYETPFFDALKSYARQPVGAFHALPVSRGNSVFGSPWLKDFAEFYGRDIFLAESSATTGGLDSLLQPTGTLKAAQERASKCYGSQQTFFVTAGTSTSNKIVIQALTKPGDIVMVDRSCHESHHFAFLLTGCCPYYVKNYSLDKYAVAGAVQLVTIKEALLDLADKDLLDRVKVIDLTNCTFDGLTYNVQHYMEEILAILPNVVFLWDEAWFAFARFVPHYRQRTAMYASEVLAERFQTDAYRKEYAEYKKRFLSKHPKFDKHWMSERLMPDPDAVRIRAYATQSTHKTLGCFRQGSMIHIHDEMFNERVRDQFNKAYFTHTTTSPNYQILASLDVSRRQVDLEGFELVQRSIEMALMIRKTINTHPLVSQYFHAAGPSELIPDEYRRSGVKSGFDPAKDWDAVARAWEVDDFVLDPCRITVDTTRTGIDGFTLRTKYLADRYNIQVNKTGLNSICIMTNIGTTRSSVAYLIACLIKIAEELATRDKGFSKEQKKKFQAEYDRMTQLPPLPNFNGFHPAFRLHPDTVPGDMRHAFFEGYEPEHIEHYHINELDEHVDAGETLVAASYVVPVPPGFPLLVPGQMLNRETLTFLQALNPNEIMGLDPDLGIRFFRKDYFERLEKGGGAKKAKRVRKAAKPG